MLKVLFIFCFSLKREFDVKIDYIFTSQTLAVLGNHDYRGDVQAQLNPFLKKLDNRWFCLRSFILNAGNLLQFKLLHNHFKNIYIA